MEQQQQQQQQQQQPPPPPQPQQQQPQPQQQEQQQQQQQQSQVSSHLGPQYTTHHQPEHFTTYHMHPPYGPNAYPYPYSPYQTPYSMAYPNVNANNAQPLTTMVNQQTQSNVPQTRPQVPIQLSHQNVNYNRTHNSNLSKNTRPKKLAILKDPNTKEVIDLPAQNSTKVTDSNSTTPSTKTSSSSKATISSSSSTPGDTSQELLKKIADVTSDNSGDVHGSSPDSKVDLKVSGEPVVAKDTKTPDEPKKVEELKKTEEPKKVEEPKKAEESKKKVDEPVVPRDHDVTQNDHVKTNELVKSDTKHDPTVSDKQVQSNNSGTKSPTPTELAKPNTKTDESGDTKENECEEDSNSDPFAQLEYSPDQYHPIKNRVGKRIYPKEFLLDVGVKICNTKLNTQENSSEDAMRVDPFAPKYNQSSSNRLGDIYRGQNNSNYNTRNNAGQDKPRKIIPATPISQDVELKQASNPWRPSKEVVKEDDTESLKKRFRSILNKLTPDNFENLALSVTDLNIDTEEKLGDVIDIVFAKALAEPGYCVLYGQMCSHLKKITAGQANFGNTLLKRCQAQFQADTYSGLNLKEREDKIETESDPDVKKQLCDELYEEKYRYRMRGLGLIKFIGELYKIEMLNDIIMMDCVLRLLQDTSEESIECLCDLLATIGEKLDKGQKNRKNSEKSANQKNQQQTNKTQKANAGQQKNFSFADVVGSPSPTTSSPQQQQKSITTLDQVFEELQKIRKTNVDLTLRIKFKLLDTCELRDKHNWQSKQTKDNNPKKLEEIREAHEKEIEQERRQQQQTLGGGARRNNQDNRGRQLGHSGGSSNQLSSLDSNGPQNHHGGRGGMHTSASSHSLRDNVSNNMDLGFHKAKDNLKNLGVLRKFNKQ